MSDTGPRHETHVLEYHLSFMPRKLTTVIFLPKKKLLPKKKREKNIWKG